MIHDQMVGYLDRYTARNIWVLRRTPSPFYVQALFVDGRPGEGFVSPIGVRLEDVPEP